MLAQRFNQRDIREREKERETERDRKREAGEILEREREALERY